MIFGEFTLEKIVTKIYKLTIYIRRMGTEKIRTFIGKLLVI